MNLLGITYTLFKNSVGPGLPNQPTGHAWLDSHGPRELRSPVAALCPARRQQSDIQKRAELIGYGLKDKMAAANVSSLILLRDVKSDNKHLIGFLFLYNPLKSFDDIYW